tara:strand:- start:185 stop:469 length:285 start_codon:yes stop_codon:yes gene_type:complete
MNIYQELITILFDYQFSDCVKNQNIKFLKVKNSDFLVIRILSKGKIADLMYESYEINQNPCSATPYKDKLIKQGFTKSDRSFIDKVIREKNNTN